MKFKDLNSIFIWQYGLLTTLNLIIYSIIISKLNILVIPVILITLLNTMIINAYNSLNDITFDKITKKGRVEAIKKIGGRKLKVIIVFISLVSIIMSIILGRLIFIINIGYLFLAFAYSYNKIRLKNVSFSQIVLGPLFYSTFPFLFLVILNNLKLIDYWTHILFLFIIVAIVSNTKDFEDVKADKRIIKTLPILFGTKKALFVINFSIIALLLASYLVFSQPNMIYLLLALCFTGGILLMLKHDYKTKEEVRSESKLATNYKLIIILYNLCVLFLNL